jgi:predicted RNase H-like HicB family nuclease
MLQIKIIVEQHPDGFIAYPLGLKGGVVGEGETYDEALQNARSAIKFHIETFGPEAFEEEQDVLEAFVDDYAVAA